MMMNVLMMGMMDMMTASLYDDIGRDNGDGKLPGNDDNNLCRWSKSLPVIEWRLIEMMIAMMMAMMMAMMVKTCVDGPTASLS